MLKVKEVTPVTTGANGTILNHSQNQGTKENGHIEHCTHTAGSADVKVQNIQHGE
jgi:hypothetical protein